MSLPLAKLQSQFAQALHYKATGESCEVVSDVFTADERMQIYRNNFVMSLCEVLEVTYPKVLALVGEECFHQMARQHVLTQPLTEGDVSGYGEGFGDTIRQFDQVIATVPYLSDMADLEWKINTSEYRLSSTQETDYFPMEALAEVTETQQPALVFHLAPQVQNIQSAFAIFSLWEALEKEEFEGLELNVPEQGVVWLDINRQLHLDPVVQEVWALINACSMGLALAEIEPELLGHLNTLMASGYIDGFSLKEQQLEEEL
ncbi:DUF2063 domain-containing protein [Vibrio nigripulchritudo]|uniref:HvfC/BufC N-terminal domain-containing protein n=1 Tax=Vibrio nigripulchritudo TaxID=28173 RepID=UPI001C762547|nr:DNA-binding domain-containing protein [Vibrio nigripulchritudo]BCL71602.1 DUF2063 domain-containing protein [Vibrio nigripulchritudo]BDU32959.1 DUF2063 domain-containing protein [Vibrio nigripulchritudo]